MEDSLNLQKFRPDTTYNTYNEAEETIFVAEKIEPKYVKLVMEKKDLCNSVKSSGTYLSYTM